MASLKCRSRSRQTQRFDVYVETLFGSAAIKHYCSWAVRLFHRALRGVY